MVKLRSLPFYCVTNLVPRAALSNLRWAEPPVDEASAVLCFDCRLCSPAIVGVDLDIDGLLRAVDADNDSFFTRRLGACSSRNIRKMSGLRRVNQF